MYKFAEWPAGIGNLLHIPARRYTDAAQKGSRSEQQGPPVAPIRVKTFESSFARHEYVPGLCQQGKSRINSNGDTVPYSHHLRPL